MRIKIGGNIYDVEFQKDLINEENEKNVWGLFLQDKNKIVIEDNLSNQTKLEVFLHECMHAIFYSGNLGVFVKKNQEENLITALASWLYAFIKDNNIEEIKKYFENLENEGDS